MYAIYECEWIFVFIFLFYVLVSSRADRKTTSVSGAVDSTGVPRLHNSGSNRNGGFFFTTTIVQYGIWNLEFGNWKLEIGNWNLEGAREI